MGFVVGGYLHVSKSKSFPGHYVGPYWDLDSGHRLLSQERGPEREAAGGSGRQQEAAGAATEQTRVGVGGRQSQAKVSGKTAREGSWQAAHTLGQPLQGLLASWARCSAGSPCGGTANKLPPPDGSGWVSFLQAKEPLKNQNKPVSGLLNSPGSFFSDFFGPSISVPRGTLRGEETVWPSREGPGLVGECPGDLPLRDQDSGKSRTQDAVCSPAAGALQPQPEEL